VSPSFLADAITSKSTERYAVKFIKRLLGENDVGAALQRLDRLTQDEARTTAAQVLEVVYGILHDMKGIIDGEQN